MLRIFESTSTLLGCTKYNSSNSYIASNTLWKWQLTNSPNRRKITNIARFQTLCPIKYKNFATGSLTIANLIG